MNSTDRYAIAHLTCPACQEPQRRVIIDGKPPRCLKCRRPVPVAQGLAKAVPRAPGY